VRVEILRLTKYAGKAKATRVAIERVLVADGDIAREAEIASTSGLVNADLESTSGDASELNAPVSYASKYVEARGPER
jgi:hypothetical protein